MKTFSIGVILISASVLVVSQRVNNLRAVFKFLHTISQTRILAFIIPGCLISAAVAQAPRPGPDYRQRLKSDPAVENRIFPRKVRLQFVNSPYADYLFYLLYRNTNEFSSVSKSVALDDIQTVHGLISLPEDVASAQIDHYRDIYRLLKPYQHLTGRIALKPKPKILGYGSSLPSYDSLLSIVRQGETSYPKFLKFWQTDVGPTEQKTIEAWTQQQAQCSPLTRLQELERLRFPFSRLDVGAIAFHFSGSGNYSPAGVYTRLFSKPNLAWVLGHEATHLQVDKYVGHNWTKHPRAAEAIAAVQALGGKEEDIEESLCLFMQITLSQECGYTDTTRRISTQLNDSPLKKKICKALEDEWSDYQRDNQKYPTIIDYLIHCTLEAMKS